MTQNRFPSLASVLHGNFILFCFFVVFICDSIVQNHKRKKRIRDMQMYVKLSKNHVNRYQNVDVPDFCHLNKSDARYIFNYISHFLIVTKMASVLEFQNSNKHITNIL